MAHVHSRRRSSAVTEACRARRGPRPPQRPRPRRGRPRRRHMHHRGRRRPGRGANRYVDGGDGGDAWLSRRTRSSTGPTRVTVAITEPGPVRRAPRHRPLPLAVACDRRRNARAPRSDDAVDVVVQTTYELRAGERFLPRAWSSTTACETTSTRPRPHPVEDSDAECALRSCCSLTAEGGPHERPPQPCRGASSTALGAVRASRCSTTVCSMRGRRGRRRGRSPPCAPPATSHGPRPAYRPNPAGPLHRLRGPRRDKGRSRWTTPCSPPWRLASRVAEAADDLLVPLEGAIVAHTAERRRSPAPHRSCAHRRRCTRQRSVARRQARPRCASWTSRRPRRQ